MKTIDFLALPEFANENFLIATYYLSFNDETDYYEWSKLIALDQSAGTWTHVEGETPEVLEKYGAKVISIYNMPASNSCITRISFPIANFPANIPMIMSTVAGNVLSQDGIKLIDIEFPRKILDNFSGPILGVAGMRELLNVKDRPLIGAILKPCIGVEPEVSAKGAVDAALGGVDLIKDDELLSETEYSPMVKRVRTVMEHLRGVGKENVLYCINITGEKLIDRANRAIEAGANSLMVNYNALGWGIIEDLVKYLKDNKHELPIFGHCAGTGGMYKSSNNGISPMLLCGKIPRIIGTDMNLVYPDSGRFGFATNELIEIHNALTSELYSVNKAFSVMAGGIHPGSVPHILNILGNDTILMAGGGIYGHPQGATAGAKAIKDTVLAIQHGLTLDEAAQNHEEVKVSLEFWRSQ